MPKAAQSRRSFVLIDSGAANHTQASEQIQAEAAECQYRRLEIRPLTAWPQEVLADVPAAK